ncbi:MAG: hypothetical protein R6U28_03085 [Cyclonatronaceae bacterium]
MAKKSSSLADFKAYLDELKGTDLKPVYAFFGEEAFFLDRLQDAAIDVIPEEARDFNLDVLYGLEVKVDKVVSICRSYPMMAEKRAVVVRDFMKMFDHRPSGTDPSSGGDTESPSSLPRDVDRIGAGAGLSAGGGERAPGSDTGSEIGAGGSGGSLDDLIAYLKQPNPSTLLFLTNEKRPAANSRIGQALRTGKLVTSHTFDLVDETQLPRWIVDWGAMEHNLQFEETAVQLLAFHIGNHLQQLTVEIEKLAASRGGDRPVSDRDVRELVGLSRDYTMFEFQDALFERDTEKAMAIAHQMMKRSDNPAGEVIRIISYFYTTFGKLWLIQRLSRKGLTPVQIREETGIKSTYYYNKLARAGRNYPLSVCPWLFEVLLDADKAIKGFSRQSPEAILLMTVKKITT